MPSFDQEEIRDLQICMARANRYQDSLNKGSSGSNITIRDLCLKVLTSSGGIMDPVMISMPGTTG
jgi:hypothetical protein